MTSDLLAGNILRWSLQIVALSAAAAAFPALARLKDPAARLAYWQSLLAACLLLPVLRPWRQSVVSVSNNFPSAGVRLPSFHPVRAAHVLPDLPTTILWVLAAGAAIRLLLIALGLFRLRRYRRNAAPLMPVSSWAVEADLLVSDEIGSPVTFGLLRPVVLLPTSFSRLEEGARDAVLCHEILHVRRKDWLFTIAEETVRALFWFHPAVWWTLGEIQLAREETVDRAAIEMLKSRDGYVDALLTLAGAAALPDLAPAPLFFRKRQLKRRLFSILKEVRMSQKRTLSTLAAGISLLAGCCWLITGAVPLNGAPQAVIDAPGVTVETNGSPLMHRPAVSYPRDAFMKGVQGSVVVQVRTDASGNAIDASVVSGPDELRRAVLQSVLNWHFAKNGGASHQIAIDFALPKDDAGKPVMVQPNGVVGVIGQARRTAGLSAVMSDTRPTPTSISQLSPPQLSPPNAPFTIKSIQVEGLSADLRDELLRSLPVHEGDTADMSRYRDIVQAAHNFDEHLMVWMNGPSGSNERTLTIRTPEAPMTFPSPPAAPQQAALPGQIRVGENVAAANLVSQDRPIYPPLAKAARVQGSVRFNVTIGKDGTVRNLMLISGPPLLVQAAMEAVRQWTYKPTLLNGEPVEVLTSITVNFTLSE